MSPQDGREKPEGLSKYLERMRNMLRPRSGSKRQSLAPQSAAPAQTTAPELPHQVQEQQASSREPARAAALTKTTAQDLDLPQPVMMTNYSLTQYEKTRALFAKYGLNLEPGEWKSPTNTQLTRVSKPIRMRVRRTCHRCETTFGADKICLTCQHTRCTKCPRYPAARTPETGDSAARKSKTPEMSVPQPLLLPRTPYLKLHGNIDLQLKKPSYTGGQDLVHRPVRQRVHRYCHQCESVFVPGEKSCPACSHVRCKLCPRDPAKLRKWPDGYAGDADPPNARPERTFKKPRRRIHYVCHVCETWYQGASVICANCGQEKCAESIRIPPKKIKPEPDPEVIKSIEDKLAGMAISEAEITKADAV